LGRGPMKPDEADERHHQLFPDRVDRGIGHLGEVLEEVVGEQPRPVRECGKRDVAPHRSHRVIGELRHGLEEEPDVLAGVTEGLLTIEQGIRIRRHRADSRRQAREMQLRAVKPLLVRPRAGQFVLQFLVGNDPVLLEVDEQHPPGL